MTLGDHISSGTSGTTDNGRHRRVRVVTAMVLLAIVLAGLGVWGRWWWSDRSYVGSTERIVLEWDCDNGIFWTHPATGVRWWAGHDPVMVGPIETASRAAPTAPGSPSLKIASGMIRFESREKAMFSSDAGGTMPFSRQPDQAFYTADCHDSG